LGDFFFNLLVTLVRNVVGIIDGILAFLNHNFPFQSDGTFDLVTKANLMRCVSLQVVFDSILIEHMEQHNIVHCFIATQKTAALRVD